MAAFLILSPKEQEEYKTYESVLAVAADPEKIAAKKNAAKEEIEALNNVHKLDFEQPSEAAALWIKGNRTLEGHGEPANASKALKYYTEAAEQGLAQAFWSLGKLYEEGLGVKENRKLALKKYKEGAEKEDANCLFTIGRIMEEEANQSLSGKVDLTEAARYYKAAADKGCAKAKTKLGHWIEEGIYSGERISDPITYYKEAAKANDGLAFNQLGIGCYKLGEYKAAIENFTLSKSLGCVNSLTNLGLCYERGTGVIKDKNTAIEFHQQAANKRHIPSILSLAFIFKQYRRYQEASMWYRQALIENSRTVEAYIGLAELYLIGKGTEKNSELAFKNFEKAGELGSGEGYKRCGDLMLGKGRMDKGAMKKAMRYYKKAVKLNNVEAMILLGEIYERGNDQVEPDIGKAVSYYDKAYSSGSPYGGIAKAMFLLERETKADKENARKIISEVVRDNPDDERLKAYMESTGILALIKGVSC
eukprot:TRINITY_DN8974_c0_g1_i2.p1 TRINITY_DN8974_c0_g1~~TRINITY_DN8974_c0_g1_i2.p1  ORF type:complete len:477 (+),score=117.47 TRINITY_DN8974_c0_g1_i2:453-1883(+)